MGDLVLLVYNICPEDKKLYNLKLQGTGCSTSHLSRGPLRPRRSEWSHTFWDPDTHVTSDLMMNHFSSVQAQEGDTQDSAKPPSPQPQATRGGLVAPKDENWQLAMDSGT